MPKLYIAFSLVFFLTSFSACLSPDKLLEKGQCRPAFGLLIKKMDRPKMQAKWSPLLRQAYHCVQSEETRQLDHLRVQNDAKYLPRLVHLYGALRDRQKRVKPYLSDLSIIDYQSSYLNYSRQAAEHFFAKAEAYFAAARQGDKPAARNAHAILSNALYFDHQDWTPTGKIQNEMFDLAMLRLQIDLQSRAEEYRAYPGLAARLIAPDRAPARKEWTEVHWQTNGERIDYYVVPQIADVKVSPSSETSDCTNYEEEIKVGEREVKKTVSKGDSTWTEIEIEEVFETIYATVCEITQSRSARLLLDLILYDPENNLIRTIPMNIRVSWSNDYDEGSGDQRAMPACFGFRHSFPNVYQMEGMLATRFLQRLEPTVLGAFP